VLPQTLRIIDANINRAGEGLRFLEDVARFLLDDSHLTERLKILRHEIAQSVSNYSVGLLFERDSAGDVGSTQALAAEGKPNVLSLVRANAKRVEEALRVIEEIAKLPEVSSSLDSSKFQKARFAVYTLEQDLVSCFLRRDKKEKLAGLYVILDTGALRGRDEVKVVQEVIKGGARVLQFRDKQRTRSQLLPVVDNLRTLCREASVLFLINDYLDLALAVDADGLHIGQDDLPLPIARRQLPIDKIIGCSTKTISQAKKAEAEGADYVAVGSIFSSTTKPDSEVVGIENLRQIKQAVSLPVVAIGGINQANIEQVLATGADSIAVISAIFGKQNVEEATRQLVARMESGG